MKVLERRDVPTSRRPHVVTSQRDDVGSTNKEVNKQKHRDVSTSRRQREICPPSLKAPRVQNSRGKRTAKGTEIQISSDTDHEEEPKICIVSHLWIIE